MFGLLSGKTVLGTLPPTSIAPVGGYLEDQLPLGGTPCQSGAMLVGESVVFKRNHKYAGQLQEQNSDSRGAHQDWARYEQDGHLSHN